ncbi:MAG TPA: QueT transporter family protein [Clostridia bacterium]|nr:QueT transporter family protein [Clostridia bacterium]
MKKPRIMFLVNSAMIAALYAGLTYFSAILGLAYGPVQLRFSEALTILPILTPAAIPGLTIGCFIGNLASPYGLADILLGTLATALAAIFTRLARHIRIKNVPFLAPLAPVVFNALIIGAGITFFTGTGANFTAFLIAAAWVGLSELIVCYTLGLPLGLALEKNNILAHTHL